MALRGGATAPPRCAIEMQFYSSPSLSFCDLETVQARCGIQNCLGPILDRCWIDFGSIFGPILDRFFDQFWIDFGQILHPKHIPTTPQTHPKHIPRTPQTHSKHTPNTPRTYPKHIQNAPQTYPKHTPNTPQKPITAKETT